MSNTSKGPVSHPPLPESVGWTDTNSDNRDDNSSASSSAGGGTEVDQLGDQSDKRQVLMDHLELIRKEAAFVRESRRIFLRRHLQQLRQRIQTGRENGVDPLSIFPEEIWRMILQNVTEPNDLDNCAKTCQLFQNILKDTKLERLFGKTFPFVSQYLRTGDESFTEDIANCRLICKQWRTHVDRFIEADDPIQTKYSSNIGMIRSLEEVPNVFYQARLLYVSHDFVLPLIPGNSLHDDMSNTVRAMRLHPGNPFLGRWIGMRALPPDSADLPTFSDEFTQFLNDFGQHIYKLQVARCDEHVFESPSQYFSIAIDCLTKCHQLRSMDYIDLDQMSQEVNWNSGSSKELPDHLHLESLWFRSAGSYHGLILQDKLMEKYSGQLKSVHVYNWNSELYSGLSWKLLTGLIIRDPLSYDIRDSLMRISAPSLQQLGISLARSGRPGLHELIQLLNHLPNLAHLKLLIYDDIEESEISQEEILKVTPGLAAACTSLTMISVLLLLDVDISYDFLICFPFLRRLVLAYKSKPESRRGRHHSDDSDSNSTSSDEGDFSEDEEAENGNEGAKAELDVGAGSEDAHLENVTGSHDSEEGTECVSGNDNGDEESEVQEMDDFWDSEDASEDEDGSNDLCTPCRLDAPTTMYKLVDLAEYLWEDPDDKRQLERIYQSNVWEIVSSLETIETSVEVKNDNDIVEDIVELIFTRQRYNFMKSVVINC